MATSMTGYIIIVIIAPMAAPPTSPPTMPACQSASPVSVAAIVSVRVSWLMGASTAQDHITMRRVVMAAHWRESHTTASVDRPTQRFIHRTAETRA